MKLGSDVKNEFILLIKHEIGGEEESTEAEKKIIVYNNCESLI